MARFTAGPGFSSARGKIAGLTYTEGQTGPTLRNRLIPPNRAATQNFLRKARFAAVAAAWRDKSNDDRLRWTSAAELFERVDSQGRRYTLAGFQFWVECAMNCLEVGLALPTTPPAPSALVVPTVTIVTASPALSTLSVSTAGSAPVGARRVVYATRTVPGALYNWSRIPYRLLASNVGTGTSNRWSAYVGIYGNLTSSYAGQRFRLKTLVITAQGLQSPASIVEGMWT